MVNLLPKVFSSRGSSSKGSSEGNDRMAKKFRPIVEAVNAFEPQMERMDNEDLQAKTEEFRQRILKGASLEELLPEAFAAVREAAKRTLGQRHFDVQLVGGAVLHYGQIAEMKTGEGKTLVATLSAYLNALTGQGVHVVTVNDYLAKRDPVWMGPIYHLLGLSVACLQHETAYMYDPAEEGSDPTLRYLRPIFRREAYAADITYGTNNEYGFDYLRDNMALDASQQVQRERNYAIVDEVDNILIDEARTPLIISGPAEEPVQLYATFAKMVPRLNEGEEEDYTIDDKGRSVSLTQQGMSKMEQWTKVGNLYDPENYHQVHYMENALTAHVLKKRDRDYVVRDNEVVLVDEFTGRLQTGRRWADGLHQAVEAKEGLRVQRESITYATITLQNYFRLYSKLAGMTGTAATEAEEFFKIYKLEVVSVPTNKPLVREELPERVYQTESARWKAVAEEIEEMHHMGRPVLVGTTSIDKSEKLSEMLDKRGLRHQVLNAKMHEKEAAVIAQAGRPGAITVATNMAGRGTDIILGGNPDAASVPQSQWEQDHQRVLDMGGLHVIGTEHHEARRIDNQLRGRTGRQGDPGSSRFYTSLEDDLMRRFGGDRIKGLLNAMKVDVDTPIENKLVAKSIGGAQVKVEAYHFDIRKHLLDYDDVLNRHREIIYTERHKVLGGADLRENILGSLVRNELSELVKRHMSARDYEDRNYAGLVADLRIVFPNLPPDLDDEEALEKLSPEDIEELLLEYADQTYIGREDEMGGENMRILERLLMLRSIDVHWVHHLTAMESLRQGVGLHAVGQRDPLVMYKTQGHRMFQEMLEKVQSDVARSVYQASLGPANGPRAQAPPPSSPMAKVNPKGRGATPAARKVGRNDACPCGSGKKYKRCHGMGG